MPSYIDKLYEFVSYVRDVFVIPSVCLNCSATTPLKGNRTTINMLKCVLMSFRKRVCVCVFEGLECHF